MPEHECKFEGVIATMREKLNNVDSKVDNLGVTTQRILTVLTGNGNDGLSTDVSKNKDAIKDLKDAHTWWRRLIIGTSITGILGGAITFVWWSLR